MTHGSSKKNEARPGGQSPDSGDGQQQVPGSAQFLHQLGTPLTVIRGQAQLIRRRSRSQGADDAALERSLTAIDSAVQQMIAVLSELSNDAREDEADAKQDDGKTKG